MSDELHELLTRAAERAADVPSWDVTQVKRRIRRGRRVRSTVTAALTVAAVGILGTTAAAFGPHARLGPPLASDTAPATSTLSGPPPSGSARPSGSAPNGMVDGACGAAIDAADLTGRAGDVAVGAVVALAARGATTVDVAVAGASLSGSTAPTATGVGVAVLLRDGVVVSRASTTVPAVDTSGIDTEPSFSASVQLPVVSCATGDALPDGDYTVGVVQPVRDGAVTRTVLAGGDVVTLAGGRPATLCEEGPLVPNATESRSAMRWKNHGLSLERVLGEPKPALPDGFTATPRVVLADEDGHVTAVETGVGGLQVVRDEQPAVYLSAAFPQSCSGAPIEPGTYRVLDVVDTDPWASAGTARIVTEIGTVKIATP